MLISRRYNFIFIHVPKTGGQTIRKYFLDVVHDIQDLYLWHLKASHAKDTIVLYDKYFSFGFTRNPWDAQLSMYSYIMQSGPSHPEWDLVSSCGSFNGYVDRVVQSQWERCLLSTTSSFLFDDDGNCLVKQIGRFERFATDLHSVISELNLPTPVLERIGATRHDDYTTYYDSGSKRLIGRIYEEDVERFTYRFGT